MLQSLWYRSELIFLNIDGKVEKRDSYIVLRTLTNPNFFWGNLLVYDRPPRKGDYQVYPPKEADTECVFIDGSNVRVHQHASGSRRGEFRAIGKSSGGPTTKIHMASDAHGNPLCIDVTGGQVHDSQVCCVQRNVFWIEVL